MKNEFVVDGFSFETKEEYEKAKGEQEVISYLETKIDFRNTAAVLSIYHKLLEKESFQTAVGLSFLKGLRTNLLSSGKIAEKDLKQIPVQAQKKAADSFTEREKKLLETGKDVSLLKELRKKKIYIRNMGIIIATLCVMLIAMVVITLFSDQDVWLDTETKIQDKYAAWEEELEQREAIVKEKEKTFAIP